MKLKELMNNQMVMNDDKNGYEKENSSNPREAKKKYYKRK